jgi:hypothetical protein
MSHPARFVTRAERARAMTGPTGGWSVIIGFVAGLVGATGVACTRESGRSICVKIERSCELSGPSACESADECVPADAYDADAFTDCVDGQCVWDCSDGEQCPGGWRCMQERESLDELLGLGC